MAVSPLLRVHTCWETATHSAKYPSYFTYLQRIFKRLLSRPCHFQPSIFAKITNAQQHHVQIAYKEFHPNPAIQKGRRKIHFLLVSKVQLPLCRSSRTNRLLCTFLAPNYIQVRREVQKIGRNFTYALTWGPDFLKTRNYSTASHSIPNFTQIGQQVCKLRLQIHLHP
jgi:hypothetical protein